MKTLTQQIAEESRNMIKVFPEVTDPNYQMFDDGGVEAQTAEFLYGLVRILRPEAVLETGTYTGISSLFIAQALKDNQKGHITTLEIENTHKERAERLWKVCGVHEYVTCKLEDAANFQPTSQYELIFLDSEPHLRWNELVKFYPHLKPGGYIGIHDCPPTMCQGNFNPDHPEIKSYPFGDIPDQMRDLIKKGLLVKFHLPNPRGSVWFYKPKDDDHKI